jgi:apolipoprotein N-acyltransferase
VHLGEKTTYAFVSNPACVLLAAFLLAAFLLAAYWNNRHLKDLDAVCEAIRITDISGTPKNAYEKAQLICAERHWQRSQPPPAPE